MEHTFHIDAVFITLALLQWYVFPGICFCKLCIYSAIIFFNYNVIFVRVLATWLIICNLKNAVKFVELLLERHIKYYNLYTVYEILYTLIVQIFLWIPWILKNEEQLKVRCSVMFVIRNCMHAQTLVMNS